MSSQRVRIDYTNWRGERRTRDVQPVGGVHFTKDEWHPEEQWMIQAVDLEKFDVRWFAMKNIHSWTPVTDADV